jgi:hypothetical protein
MFDSLTHALFGTAGASGNIANTAQALPGAMYQGSISASQFNQILKHEQAPKSRKLFHGTVEVLQVANGYIVNIGRKEGYEYETYIAETITDVNERIAAAIVAFQLEGK